MFFILQLIGVSADVLLFFTVIANFLNSAVVTAQIMVYC